MLKLGMETQGTAIPGDVIIRRDNSHILTAGREESGKAMRVKYKTSN